MYKPSIF